MITKQCYDSICFIPLIDNGTRLFGFPEYLSALALMAIVWTVSGYQYRFRIKTALIDLQNIAFSATLILGFLTLFTDLWRAEKWLVPIGDLFSPYLWQALLGLSFLMIFLSLAWAAFAYPPVYNKYSAKRFVEVVFQAVIQGSLEDLSIISTELRRSIKKIISLAPNLKKDKSLSEEERQTHNLLLLMGDKRFCRSIVKSSPVTVFLVFDEMTQQNKYALSTEVFCRNVLNEALSDTDSFLFHETDSYTSGMLGDLKPYSKALFGDYKLIEALNCHFNFDWDFLNSWNKKQWEVYCRLYLITLEAYLLNPPYRYSYQLHIGLNNITSAFRRISELNESITLYPNEQLDKLRVIISFIHDYVELLEKYGPPINKKENSPIYDDLTQMILEIISQAAKVASPKYVSWFLQHNSIWSELFGLHHLKGKAGKIILYKLCRVLYKEISEMNDYPNYVGMPILGFCLNVLRFETIRPEEREITALRKVIIRWTINNFVKHYENYPDVTKTSLVCGLSYDETNSRLVYAYASTLGKEPECNYLPLQTHSQ